MYEVNSVSYDVHFSQRGVHTESIEVLFVCHDGGSLGTVNIFSKITNPLHHTTKRGHFFARAICENRAEVKHLIENFEANLSAFVDYNHKPAAQLQRVDDTFFEVKPPEKPKRQRRTKIDENTIYADTENVYQQTTE